MGNALDETLAVLNGVVGDYLKRTDNALATEMALYRDGKQLTLEQQALLRALPTPSPRVAVLLHGVACTESIFRMRDGSDYGSLLARDFGVTPLYVRYNSGLPIGDNGRSFASLLDALLASYPIPIEEIIPIGYSMGGLVVRSACHFGVTRSAAWLPLMKRVFYVGTPHLGAPSERLGRVVARVLGAIDDPYTKLIADLANLRSAGVKDLGNADLRAEDREGQGKRWSLGDAEHPVPLLPSIQHYLIAGSLTDTPMLDTWFGDAMVPVTSGTMHNVALPKERVKVLAGTSHVAIAQSPAAYARIKAWYEEMP